MKVAGGKPASGAPTGSRPPGFPAPRQGRMNAVGGGASQAPLRGAGDIGTAFRWVLPSRVPPGHYRGRSSSITLNKYSAKGRFLATQW